MAVGRFPRLLVMTSTAPGGCCGSIEYRLPGVEPPATNTLPRAISVATALVAPVQVPRISPSLPFTRVTVSSPLLGTHTSLPSDLIRRGLTPTLVMPRPPEVCVVQNCPSAARLLPRARA